MFRQNFYCFRHTESLPKYPSLARKQNYVFIRRSDQQKFGVFVERIVIDGVSKHKRLYLSETGVKLNFSV